MRVDPSVAVFVLDYSTSGVRYSGGRYHGLLLSWALAYSGIDVVVVADKKPAFFDELAEEYGPIVSLERITDVESGSVTLDVTHVVVVPTGGLRPDFYSCAESLAERTGAVRVLINFESPNWFNTLVPDPDYLEVWDSWHRVVVRGGLVISSTAESDRFARQYYRSDGNPLTFLHCYPPLNSRAGTRSWNDPSLRKDGAIACFVRPFHTHKGSQDLLALPSELFAGRTVRVIFGGTIDETYVRQLEVIVRMGGGWLEVHSAVTERKKFELLKRSALLLFPSYFEGFGYPPLEAALVGTDSVCYDLPVLRETLGSIGRLVPVGDIRRLASAAHETLSSPTDGIILREHAEQLAGFFPARERLSRYFRNTAPCRPKTRVNHVVEWGPQAVEEIVLADNCSRKPDLFPPMPVHGWANDTAPGLGNLTIVWWSVKQVTAAELICGSLQVKASSVSCKPFNRDWNRTVVVFIFDLDSAGEVVVVGHDRAGETIFTSHPFRVRTIPRD